MWYGLCFCLIDSSYQHCDGVWIRIILCNEINWPFLNKCSHQLPCSAEKRKDPNQSGNKLRLSSKTCSNYAETFLLVGQCFFPFFSARFVSCIEKEEKRKEKTECDGIMGVRQSFPIQAFSNATLFMSTNFAFVILKTLFFFLSILDRKKPQLMERVWVCCMFIP